MIWFAFALAGALSQAGYGLAVKVLLRTVRPFPLAGFSFLAGSVVLFIVSFTAGIPDTGPGLLGAIAVTVGINIVATILLYRALGTTDLSLSVPMLAFTPVFLILTSFLILSEIPTSAGAAGILLVASGAYLLNLEYRDGYPCSLTGPFLRLRYDRGIQAMLLVAFLYSISVNYDKRVVLASDPVFGSAIVLLMLGAAFLILAALARRGGGRVVPGRLARKMQGPGRSEGECSARTAAHHPWHSPTQERGRSARERPAGEQEGAGGSPPVVPALLRERILPRSLMFAAIGFVLALEVIAINTAYTMAIVPYVITVKRLAIFFSVLAGGLFLGERQLGGRIAGAAVMIAGAAVIALWG